MNKVEISKSKFTEEFEGVVTSDVFQLYEECAGEIWSNRIHLKASSYFKLPDDSWLVASKEIKLGYWVNDYNEDECQNVCALLNENFEWIDEDRVWFCMSKKLVIESSWSSFKKNWISFIECDDDCPIILNQNDPRVALIFKSMGAFVKIETN